MWVRTAYFTFPLDQKKPPNVSFPMRTYLVSHDAPLRLFVPGHAVSGGRGVLTLHGVSPSSDPAGAQGGPVLTQLIHAGLPGHVEPHGLLVVDVDALSGRHVTLMTHSDLKTAFKRKVIVLLHV